MPTTATLVCTLLCTALFAQQKGTFTDTRDGKTYKTVKIGEQVWMAENLNYEASGSKCYDNEPANCKKYGRLYNWNTAKTACPSGWHLPDTTEWEVLTAVVDKETAGNYLKATSGWNDCKQLTGYDVKKQRKTYEVKSCNGEDKYGFSALPGGYYGGLLDINFYRVGEEGYWWDANEVNNHDAHGRYMLYKSNNVRRYEFFKYALLSVRCLKDR